VAKLSWTVHNGAAWTDVHISNFPQPCSSGIWVMAASRNSNMIIGGTSHVGLWGSNDGGATWSQLASGAGSDQITHDTFWVWIDPANPNSIWESGIHAGEAVYHSNDGGLTFKRLGQFSASDFVSLDITDPNRKTVLAGTHEATQMVWKSTDGGTTWTNIGLNLPANTNFSTTPLAIDSQTYIVNTAGYISGDSGMWKTTNGGASWVKTSSTFSPSGSPKSPLLASNGIIYWPYGDGVIKSTDKGSTWTHVGSGLLDTTPGELPDGRLFSVSSSRIMLSSDGGVSWSPYGATTPYSPTGIIYSPVRKAFFIWNADLCSSAANSVMRLDADMGGSGTPVPTPTLAPTPTVVPTPFPTPTNTPSPTPGSGACQGADIDKNGAVNIFDYNILVGNFGKSGSGLQGDIDNNGTVNIFDYNTLVGNFGKTGC
jgi:hypothetical protein